MKKLILALFLSAAVAFAQSAPPSPEALAACSGVAEGGGCTVKLEDGAHQGVCLKAPRDEAPSCMPKPVPMPVPAAPASSS